MIERQYRQPPWMGWLTVIVLVAAIVAAVHWVRCRMVETELLERRPIPPYR
jgi:hypothetical protein